jgi:hypothetical protein
VCTVGFAAQRSTALSSQNRSLELRDRDVRSYRVRQPLVAIGPCLQEPALTAHAAELQIHLALAGVCAPSFPFVLCFPVRSAAVSRRSLGRELPYVGRRVRARLGAARAERRWAHAPATVRVVPQRACGDTSARRRRLVRTNGAGRPAPRRMCGGQSAAPHSCGCWVQEPAEAPGTRRGPDGHRPAQAGKPGRPCRWLSPPSAAADCAAVCMQGRRAVTSIAAPGRTVMLGSCRACLGR